ncbi:hypothetical protein D5Q77_24280 [Salmonella enterica subsp. enterica serovar Schwarzengrund]|nr:hypothetical protein D5Q77_24280 [Salmonella enterica subsp. enterica serovar Schwarzengrund]
MKDGKKIDNVSLISKTNVGYVSYKNSFDDKNNCDKRIEEMQNSKELYFSQNGSINLNSDVDLGASVLNLIKIQIGK